MVPAVRRRAMHTWSCFTNRGRVLLFSPVFLSTIQIKACGRHKQTHSGDILTPTSLKQSQVFPNDPLHAFFKSYRNLHLLNAGVNVENSVVTRTDDGFVFDDDNLWREGGGRHQTQTNKCQTWTKLSHNIEICGGENLPPDRTGNLFILAPNMFCPNTEYGTRKIAICYMVRLTVKTCKIKF